MFAFTEEAGRTLRKKGSAITVRMVRKKACGG